MGKQKNKDINSIYLIKGNIDTWIKNNACANEKTLLPILKKAVCGKKDTCKEPFELLCATLRYAILDVAGISVETFYNIYSTETLLDMKISNLVGNIINNAPDELRLQCYFNKKEIVFTSAFPDFAERKKITYQDVYLAKGELAASLKNASGINYGSLKDGNDTTTLNKSGTYKKERSSGVKNYGALVDNLMYKVIDEALSSLGLDDFTSKLNYLSDIKECYKNTGNQLPGVYGIIDKRGCYGSYVDFFMLNAPVELQELYFKEFLEIRSKTQDTDDMLEAIIEVYNDEFDDLD